MMAGRSIGDGGAGEHARDDSDQQPDGPRPAADHLNGSGGRQPAARPATGQPAYPFAAIVGMADLKLALLLNAVSPAIGGVLVRGEKGTAKSTVVRGLAALLPSADVVAGCRFACDPAAPDPGCPDGPHPDRPARLRRPARLAELPVGATEDRLAGSLDIERALTEGIAAFEPGLLAAAHRGLLYVDEVNLLHDHLVDLLLDAAALGVNYVEREGLSVRHAARFLLVGTMNPEEGELRPQLLDRFGLTVEVAATRDPAQRAEVVRRRLAYEADPAGFATDWVLDSERIARRVVSARERLPSVRLPDDVLRQICAVCGAFEVDGLRADLVTARTAIALAAWHDRDEVGEDDVRQAARLALPHRRRRDPFDVPGLDEQALDEALQDALGSGQPAGASGGAPDGTGPEPPDGTDPDGSHPDGPDDHHPDGGGPDRGGPGGAPLPGANGHEPAHDPAKTKSPHHPDQQPAAALAEGQPGAARSDPATGAAAPFRPRLLTVTGIGQGAPGRRSAARTPYGRVTGARLRAGRVHSVHLPATLRAAAPRIGRAVQQEAQQLAAPARAASPRPDSLAGRHPDRPGQRSAPRPAVPRQAGPPRIGPRLRIRPSDLRETVRVGREGNLVLFVVDASGSMAAGQRIRAVKSAVLSLLLDAYQRRDKVGLVTFRGAAADLALPPTSSVEAGARRLAALPTGGRTPLAAGLVLAARVLRAERLRDPDRRPLLVVVTDGRATSGTGADLARAVGALAGVAAVVIDCESGPVRLGLAVRLAAQLGGSAVRLAELAAGGITGVVSAHVPARRRAHAPAGRMAGPRRGVA
jgi:magnesium chelatase subunit D